MKKILSLVLLVFVSLHSHSQSDSISKNHFGVSVGFSVNTLNTHTNQYPFCRYVDRSSVRLDYKEKLYINAFHDALYMPLIEFNYITHDNRIIHTLGIGYNEQDYKDYKMVGAVAPSYGHFTNFNLNYQFTRFLPSEKSLHFFVAIKGSFSIKTLNFSTVLDVGGEDVITDKSQPILIQIPIGITYLKRNFRLSLSPTFNIFAIINGTQNFIPSIMNGAKQESIPYSKVLFIDKIITDEKVFPNISIKMCFTF